MPKAETTPLRRCTGNAGDIRDPESLLQSQNAGITKRASCHTLRHTFATYKAEKGVSPFQLQQWLGHANLNTTQIYVHLGKQNAKKIMEQTSLA